MSVPGESRKVMQSVLDQWAAVEKLGNESMRVLPPEECARIHRTRRQSAERALKTLEEDAAAAHAATPPGVPDPDYDDEAAEELRLILTRQAGE